MDGDVFGAQLHDLVKGRREDGETVTRQARDKIRINDGNTRSASNLKGAEEILGGVGAADTAQHLVRKGLGIDADTDDTVLTGHGKLFSGNGVGAAGFEGVLLQRADIGHALDRREQAGELVNVQNSGRAATDVDGTNSQAKTGDQSKDALKLLQQALQIVGNEGQKALGRVGHKGAVRTAGGAEGDRDVDRAILPSGRADQPRLVGGHLSSQGGLLGDDKIIPIELLAHTGLGISLLQKLGSHLGGAHAGEHTPGGAIGHHLTAHRGDGVAKGDLLQPLARVALAVIIVTGGLSLLVAEAEASVHIHTCLVGFGHGNPKLRGLRPLGLLVREFGAGEIDHAQGLDIVFINRAVNV